MRLRNRVREVRKARQLSQESLCKLAGVSRGTLSPIEQDNGHEPYGWVMTHLSRTLEDPALFWWEEVTESETAEVA